MKKGAIFKIQFDANGDLRWALFAGNGRELCRSSDPMFKRKNGERSVDRLKAALQEISDSDIVDAMLDFRRTALSAAVEKGPGRGRRAA